VLVAVVRLLSVVRPVLSTECDRRNLLITLIVCCVDNTCGTTRKSNRRWASFLSQRLHVVRSVPQWSGVREEIDLDGLRTVELVVQPRRGNARRINCLK